MNNQIRIVSHDGSVVEYLDEGEGQCIVLLPSLGRGPADFDGITERLAQRGFRVLRPFPRGLSLSQGNSVATSLRDLAEDVLAVIRATCDEPPVVAGHAYGNFVARMLATCWPATVAGVALLAASAGKAPPGEEIIPPDIMASVKASGDLSLSREERLGHLRKAFFAPGNDESVWLGGWYPHIKPMQLAAWESTPVDAYFAAGGKPVLDLQAAEDSVAPRRFAHVLASALGSRVTVCVIANAGHALLPEQPDAVAEALALWSPSVFRTHEIDHS